MFTLRGDGESLGNGEIVDGLDGYECGFLLENHGCTAYNINPYTHGIAKKGSENWVEKYIDKDKNK